MNPIKEQYKQALFIACDLLNGSILYGIDADKLFEIMMEKEGVVSTFVYQDYILNNLDRFSDDDSIRAKAIERLGW
jgi:hypothetical protein